MSDYRDEKHSYKMWYETALLIFIYNKYIYSYCIANYIVSVQQLHVGCYIKLYGTHTLVHLFTSLCM